MSFDVCCVCVIIKDGSCRKEKRNKCYPTVYRAGKRKEKVLPALLKLEKYNLLFTISASRVCPMLQDKLTFCTQTPRILDTHTTIITYTISPFLMVERI